MAPTLRDAGVGWRPHTKAIKTPAIAHLLLRAGAFGVTCAKVGEAEVMAAAGVRDILIANQVVGESKIARLVNLLPYADVVVAVDSRENVEALNRRACAVGRRLRVVIEVDVGMHRAGVLPVRVLELATCMASRPGLRFAGVMGWEGQAVGIADPAEKERAVAESVRSADGLAAACASAGFACDIVSCGGTGTYQITSRLPALRNSGGRRHFRRRALPQPHARRPRVCADGPGDGHQAADADAHHLRRGQEDDEQRRRRTAAASRH